jgi:hypothetical protein
MATSASTLMSGGARLGSTSNRLIEKEVKVAAKIESKIGATMLDVHPTDAIGGRLAALGGGLVVKSSEQLEQLNIVTIASTNSMR